MKRFTIAFALLGILVLATFTVASTAGAHSNCVRTDKDGWHLTGCVSGDGTVTWTAIGPNGNLYQWADDEWQLQEPPALPEIEPIVLVQTSKSFPFVGAGTHSYAPHVVYEADKSPSSERVFSSILIAAESTRSEPVWLRISCGSATGAVTLDFLHTSRFRVIGEDQKEVVLAMKVDGVRVHVAPLDPASATLTERLEALRRNFFYIGNGGSMLEAMRSDWVYEQIRDSRYLEMRIRGHSDPVVFRFDLKSLFDTPIQRNIDECGE